MSTPSLSQSVPCAAVPAEGGARICGVSERHFWAMHSSGRLGPLPIAFGRAKRWVVSELLEWLECGAPPRDKWLAIKDQKKASK